MSNDKTTHLTGTVSKATLSGQGSMLGPREIEVIASTGIVDLSDDEVVPGGMTPRTTDVPVFLNHQSSGNNIPIGRAYLRVTSTAVVGKIVFSPEGDNELADQVSRACKNGAMDAVSIGFTPVKTSRRPGGKGLKYETWMCNELSVVGVGANPQARITQRELANAGSAEAEQATRLRKAVEALAKGARMERAAEVRRAGEVPAAASVPHPVDSLDRAGREAYARSVIERNAPPAPRAPLSPREAVVQANADHFNATRRAEREKHGTRESRTIQAGMAARASRPVGFG